MTYCFLTAEAVYSGCSVARLSRLLWEQEAAGSNPATPTNPTINGCKNTVNLLIFSVLLFFDII